jgi:hypothetical protein
VSDVVRLRTFPQAEVRAWLQALQSPESYDDPTLEYEGITLGNVLDGKSAVAISTAKPAAPVATPATMPPSTPGHRLHRRDRAPAVAYALIAAPRHCGAGRIVLAAALGLAAFGLAVIGLTVNTRFAASFGQTAEAALLLASLGLAIDLLAIVLPSAAAQLWRDRHRVAGIAAWSIWLIALMMTLLAAMGFAATNIGDGVAGRGKVASETTGLAADVARLRTERAAVTELRSVATIEAEIQRAQPSAAAVWRQTAGCSDITLAASGAACAEILKLRQALGAAQRRDTTDAELRNAEARLAALPAITTGDPQATMAADILAWASAGHVSLTPHDIHRLRITGLTIIPALAGIIFMFAVMLLRVEKSAGNLSRWLDGAPQRHPISLASEDITGRH